VYVGERSFYFDSLALGFNIKNSIYAEISYNYDTLGRFSFVRKELPNDYFSGKIYKLNKKKIEKIE